MRTTLSGSRRAIGLVASAVALAALVTSCGSTASDTSVNSEGTQFPVIVEHVYRSTAIDSRLQRITLWS
ncbi:uncharacterized membrane protein YidH (DUF202 family) [Rhodococcus sp. 27YEA15]|uniref:hypothetical protein n=1 Tax=Rhodococcus sp. 27YEA15 TaxID=3156259 RepID=UPI003C7D1DD7